MGTCLPQSTVEFKAEGVLDTKSVSDGFFEGECEEEIITGQWEYLGNNQFAIIIDGEENIAELIFSENGTVFSETTIYEDGTVDVVSFIKID